MGTTMQTHSSAAPGFKPTYTEAREAWLAAVAMREGRLESLRHPGTGPGGEALWLDLARFGDEQAESVLVIACGTHGIEGYAGSAAQTAWLIERGPGALPPGHAVVLLHAVNPWGFAHRQRATENNVDLNRNFRDFSIAPPPNPGYDRLHPQLMLEAWDEASIANAFAAMDSFRAEVGEKAFSDAFNGGQFSRPDGIFYGGKQPEWSNLALRDLLRRHLSQAKRCVFVDLHTGIGPYGQPFLINVDAAGTPGRDRALAIWGEEALSGKGSTHAAMATYQGLLLDAFSIELPHCQVSAVAIEFGTHERRRMQRAHLAQTWLRRQPATGHPDPDALQRARAEYDEAFLPADPAWRTSVLQSGVAVCERACEAVMRLGQ